MKKPDLLILVAIWDFITAFLAFIGFVVLLGLTLLPAFAPGDFPKWLFVTLLGVGMFILLLFIGLGVTAGVGVLAGREWGRILALTQAGLSLLNTPIGTAVGVLIIIYLVRPEVVAYFKSPPADTIKP